jgi:hypothetical protein
LQDLQHLNRCDAHDYKKTQYRLKRLSSNFITTDLV